MEVGKLNRLLIIITLSLFFSNAMSAISVDTRIDSLKNLLKISTDIEKIDILNELIKTYDTVSYFKSLDYAIQALELTRKLKSEEDVAILLFRIGKINYYLSNYDESIDYFLESLKIREKSNNKKAISESYNSLGAIYMELKDNNKALDFFQKAWDLSKESGDESFLKKVSNNLGIIYTRKNDYNKALEYYQETINFSKKTNDNKIWCITLNNIGAVYWYLENYNKALEYYLAALTIGEKARYKWGISTASTNIGQVYLKLHDYDKSELYLEKGLEIAREINSKQLVRNCFDAFSELNYYKANYKKAYEYHKLFSEVKDSIFSEEMGKNMATMGAKFDILKKEKENDILKKENEINVLKLKKQRNQRNLLTITSLCILLSIVVLYNQFLLKKRDNKLLEAAIKKISKSETDLKESNTAKDKLLSIIAHDLRNPFNALIGLTDFLNESAERLTSEEIKEISSHINISSNKVLTLIDSLLDWSRSQTGKLMMLPTYINIKEITDTCIEVASISANEKNISLKSRLNGSEIAFADKDSITTVFRNILSNAIKFTPDKGEISIWSNKENSTINIFITDTGVGISSENIPKLFKIDGCISTKGTTQETGTGLGLIICKEFVEKNNGNINVESKINVGTTFKISLPIETSKN